MRRSVKLTLAVAMVAIVLASGPAAACHNPECIELPCTPCQHSTGSVLHELAHHAPFGGLVPLAAFGAALVVAGHRVRG